MKLLIVNADDFGATLGVNRAIIESYHAGVVSSTSLMANMPAFEEAVSLAKTNTGLGVGVHLTLASGNPLLPAHVVPSLVDDGGRLFSRRRLMVGLATKRTRLEEVERELRAQIEMVFETGISPDHMDGDKHIHILPGIRRIVVKLSHELRLPLRIPNERLIISNGLSSLLSKRALPGVAAILGRRMMALVTKRLCLEQGVPHNDNFVSIFGIVPREAPLQVHLDMLLSRVGDGVTEMMVHPAYYDEHLENFYGEAHLSREREVELRCLLEPEFRENMKERGITIGTYKYVQGVT
jgi:predicted glycoside hydrolase/deacetylase ChbG (UPF0249 family)